MTPIEIKIKLLEIETTQAEIARDVGVSRTYVNRIINGLTIFNPKTNRVWQKLKELKVV